MPLADLSVAQAAARSGRKGEGEGVYAHDVGQGLGWETTMWGGSEAWNKERGPTQGSLSQKPWLPCQHR